MVVGSSARPEVDGGWNREGPVGCDVLLAFDLSWWESIGGFFQCHDRLWSPSSEDHADTLYDRISVKYKTGKLTCAARGQESCYPGWGVVTERALEDVWEAGNVLFLCLSAGPSRVLNM